MNSQIKLSQHLMRERAGRYAFIATTVGLGEIVHKHSRLHIRDNKPCTVGITSTGVIVVTGEDDTIVTLYLGTITEVQTYFDKGKVPCVLEAIVRTNMKRGYISLQNTFD